MDTFREHQQKAARARWAKVGAVERSAIARKAIAARWEKAKNK